MKKFFQILSDSLVWASGFLLGFVRRRPRYIQLALALAVACGLFYFLFPDQSQSGVGEVVSTEGSSVQERTRAMRQKARRAALRAQVARLLEQSPRNLTPPPGESREVAEVKIPQELVEAGVTQLGEPWPKREEPRDMSGEIPPPLQGLRGSEMERLLVMGPREETSKIKGPFGIVQRGEGLLGKQERNGGQQRFLSAKELAEELRVRDQEKRDTIPPSLRAWVDREPVRVRDSENGEPVMLSQTPKATTEPESSEVAVKTKPLGGGNSMGSWVGILQPLYLLLLLVLVPVLLTKLVLRRDWQYRYPAFAMLMICPLLYFMLPEGSGTSSMTTEVTQENSRGVLARDRARHLHQSAQVAGERDKL